jgi:hypothetical protein
MSMASETRFLSKIHDMTVGSDDEEVTGTAARILTKYLALEVGEHDLLQKLTYFKPRIPIHG